MAGNDPNVSLKPQDENYPPGVALDPGHLHDGASLINVKGLPMGLTGATAPARFVGGTVSGAPVSGTFAKGDFIVDESGSVYVCTTAGTPGTWAQVGGGGGGGTVDSVTAGDSSVTVGGTSANPTVAVSAAGTAGTYGDAAHTLVITTNAKGQVTAVTVDSISVTHSAISDWSTALATALTGYFDIAGTGLTSSGSTVSLPNVGTAATSGDASHTLVITTDAEGRVSGVTVDAIAIAESQVTGLVSALAALAPLASPSFTGVPLVPTATPLTNNTQVASTAYADAAVAVEKTRALAAEAVLASFHAGIYGDGSDGTVTFLSTGSVTVAGATCVSGVYTMQRDIFLASGSAINVGSVVIPNGYRIFFQGTLTNNGTIQWNGNAGSAGTTTSGTAGPALTSAQSSINSSATLGAAGGAGTLAVAGNAGSGQGSRSFGGYGGHGGSGATLGGGAGGTATPPSASSGSLRSVPTAIIGQFMANSSAATVFGGAGGGGGSGQALEAGGGGGGGGGVIIIVGQTFAGTGAIQARGGAGGNGFSFASDETGGGGGGGGGLVIVVSSSIASGAIAGQTIDAAGGAAGSSGTGSTGVTAGSSGTVILIPG